MRSQHEHEVVLRDACRGVEFDAVEELTVARLAQLDDRTVQTLCSLLEKVREVGYVERLHAATEPPPAWPALGGRGVAGNSGPGW
jgi:hypothetical protein